MEFFDYPLFESSKSHYALRYRNAFEKKVMTMLDSDPSVKSYFQPLPSASIYLNGKQHNITINFCVEYHKGEMELIHIQTESEFSTQEKLQILTATKSFLNLCGIGFVVLFENRTKRMPSDFLDLNYINYAFNFCFANYNWIN